MRSLALSAALVCAACTTPSEPESADRLGVVQGSLEVPVTADVWAFLYRPGEGPPGAPVAPAFFSAVSAARVAESAHYVIANVKPNPWRLYGVLDVDGDFDLSIDVLSQPTAGDRVSRGVEFQSQPGRGATVSLEIREPIFTEPPAFSFEGEPDLDVTLDPALDAVTPLTLVADSLNGRFDAKKIGFTFGLVDADGDGRPDDVNGDGTPDLTTQFFLRWKPRPGQVAEGVQVIVPLAFDPSPFIRTLEGRLDTTVSTSRLQVVMVPQAQALGPADDGGSGLSNFGAPPQGEYELVILSASGQFWRVPNGLGASTPTQGTRLHIDRAIR